MTSYVSAELRRLVINRANRICEYCLIHESDTYLGCQVDHIIAEKHGGLTEADNLCYACVFCNRSKGTDVGSIVTGCQDFIRFFNPRIDLWSDHFDLAGAEIKSRTQIGEATVFILGLNAVERVLERESLQLIDKYPPPEAAIHLK